ncbi:taurine dioxygenase [Achromobacter aloeverae]|uniref:Taurine dioxygenase n=2 Tax=Achromobacter aloeverae TaxID=1750518 RepID=A0A4Q1HN38_9BURK|nr:taurine dioxygenase [Achromobacter aloeverae]
MEQGSAAELADFKTLRVVPMAGALGAEIFGVNLSEALEAPVLDEVKRAYHQFGVIFFRDQDVSDLDLARFARYFGELAVLPPHRQHPGSLPELLVIDKKPETKLVFGWEWHSDTTHLEIPPLGSVLAAKRLPTVGGDTLFANQYLAYDTLSGGMKRMLDGMRAVHSNGRILSSLEADDVLAPGQGVGSAKTTISAVHPVVRTHPVTGRKALFVNEMHTERFKDMTIAESAPLLRFLYDHSTRPEFTCRFRWAPGSVAFWDNRCLQHLALDDYHGQRRLMHRVQIRGTRPV